MTKKTEAELPDTDDAAAAGAISDQNRIDFNEPMRCDADVVTERLGMTASKDAG